MKCMTSFAAIASVVALTAAGGAFAQGALVGIEGLDDRIDDIQTDVTDAFDQSNDPARFGGNQFQQGWTGSLSGSLSATSGNTDTFDTSIGARFRYGAGQWNHTLGFALEYGEDEGTRSKEELFLTYDVNRYLTDDLYVFGLGSFRYDDFGSNKYDTFLGFGPGYRIVNTETVAWRVQAGPGVRYTEDQAGEDNTEFAGIASSRVYYKLSEQVFLTNDTDVLYSEAGTLATNEFGVNLEITDTMSTRLGLRTDYDSDPLPGFKNTDNSVTAAIIVGF